jgi:tmRNA-binding protein
MYLNQYMIDGTNNLDSHGCFHSENTYPNFQEELDKFKNHITDLVDNKESKTFYKFGDGDYYFLRGQEVGSASPGKRALSVSYDEINHKAFVDGALLNDYYTCEIYPENRQKFKEVILNKNIDYPAEYGYGLVANKWFFKNFSGKIGLIGASEKLYLIEELMKHDQYKEYLGLDNFNDYIHFPQKYACDDIDLVENFVGDQLKESNSDIFLLGIGHSKSAILHRFKKYTNSIFMDVGAGIDNVAGCINITRPYAGDWINYRIKDYDYSNIDYLRYEGRGEHIIL